MLKKSTIFAAIMLASTSTAHADLFDISAGLNLWNNNMNVRARYNGNFDSYNDKKEITPVIWAKIEHKVPVLPNFKLRYTNIEHSAKTIITGYLRIDDTTYNEHTAVKITPKLSHFDVTPYYNAVNNDAMSLGFGLNVKIADFKYQTTDGTSPSELDLEDNIVVLPYICTEIKLPFDISIKGDAAGVNLVSNNFLFYDTEIALAWKMFDIADVGTSIEAGYRYIYTSYRKNYGPYFYSSETHIKYKSEGVFAGISVNY